MPPQILAPAGNRDCFLAAIAAGADAIYCGLKRFSARMEAKNFSVEELAALTSLAHEKGSAVFVAINSMIRPEELDEVYRMVSILAQRVVPDALIIQDLGIVSLARKAGFKGEIHLSTLANACFPDALGQLSATLGLDRVVLPRELGIDEIKEMAKACPEHFGLEVFVHGALCYGVSGRCYWSSFLGGKSGLRGSCVQPCRRRYTHSGKKGRLFSCLDLSLDVLTKVLLDLPQIRAWKIEGRKKGPHYVYQTVSAYRLLRDAPKDPAARKQAMDMLENALGRPTTHYRFLDHRPQSPLAPGQQTGSGKRIGKIVGTPQKPLILAFEALEPGDTIRVGYEDDPYHTLLRIDRLWIPSSRIPLPQEASGRIEPGAPVFLTDRKQRELERLLQSMSKITGIAADNGALIPQEKRLKSAGPPPLLLKPGGSRNAPVHARIRTRDLTVYRVPSPRQQARKQEIGFWLSTEHPGAAFPENAWIWLPPVVWPADADEWRTRVRSLCDQGHRRFVLNIPYQIAWFPDAIPLERGGGPPLKRGRQDISRYAHRNDPSKTAKKRFELWAGPFCNIANPSAVSMLQRMGFSGVIVSPELGKADYLALPAQSPLPLGMLLSGLWPLSISRLAPEGIGFESAIQSPKGEMCFLKSRDQTVWVYPNWEIHLEAHRNTLEQAGYRLFIHLVEPVPEGISLKKRPGLWNWEHSLS